MPFSPEPDDSAASMGRRLRQQRSGRLLTRSLASFLGLLMLLAAGLATAQLIVAGWNIASLILLVGAALALAYLIWLAFIKIEKSYDGQPLTGHDADHLARRKARQHHRIDHSK